MASELRVAAVSAACVIAVGVAMFASRTAVPGDALHPVRTVMQDIGLADYTLDDVDPLEQEARSHVRPRRLRRASLTRSPSSTTSR